MTITRSAVAAISLLLLGAAQSGLEARAIQSTADRTGHLAGVVYDDQSSQAVAFATVTIWRNDDRRVVRADESGQFEFRDIPVGLYHAAVALPDGQTFDLPDTRTAIVWPDRVLEWRVHVTRFPTRGSGTEDERAARFQALEQAVMRWNASRPDAYEYSVQVRCFCPGPRTPARYHVEAGQAVVVGPDPGGRRLMLESYNTVEEMFAQVASAIDRRPERFVVDYDPERGFPRRLDVDTSRMIMDEEIELTVTDFEVAATGAVLGSGVLAGHVRLVDDTLAAGVEVTISRSGMTREVTTDTGGAFRFDGLPTGVYVLDAVREGFVTTSRHAPAVLVFPDREAEAVVWMVEDRPVSVSAAPSGPSITGRATTGADPIPGVTVAVVDERGRRTEAVTGVDGFYRFPGLEPGRYRLSARLTGFRSIATLPQERLVDVARGRTATVNVALEVAFVGDGSAADRQSRLEWLDRQMNRWVDFGIDSYDMTVESRCFGACDTFSFQVRNRQVTTSPTDTSGWPGEMVAGLFGTVEALFERVLEHVERTPDVFQVSYDVVLGYPQSMTADIMRFGSDDELTFAVTAWRIQR